MNLNIMMRYPGEPRMLKTIKINFLTSECQHAGVQLSKEKYFDH